MYQDSSTLFRDAQAPGIDALWLSWGIGLVNFVLVVENNLPLPEFLLTRNQLWASRVLAH